MISVGLSCGSACELIRCLLSLSKLNINPEHGQRQSDYFQAIFEDQAIFEEQMCSFMIYSAGEF